MKRIVLLVALLLVLMLAPAAAAGSIAEPVVLGLDNWYRSHPMPATPGITGEVVFQSPRSAVIVRQAPVGTSAAPHYHNVADEIVYVVAGSAELLTNGAWVKLQPGDVHVNPRGAVHALKITDAKGCKFVSVFAPPQPKTGDATYSSDGTQLQTPAGMIDANTGAGIVVGLKEWEDRPVVQPGQFDGSIIMPDLLENDGLKSVSIIETPRSVVMLRQAGYGASHSHTQDQADEIVLVVSGSARAYSGDRTYVLAKNYLQIVPMGLDHSMQLLLGDSIRFIDIFALPERVGSRKPLILR